MVHNVAKRDFEDNSFNILPNARLQLSFGAHVPVTMLVLFLLGSYASSAFADGHVLQALGGVFGFVFGLILETTLFIIRSVPQPRIQEPKRICPVNWMADGWICYWNRFCFSPFSNAVL